MGAFGNYPTPHKFQIDFTRNRPVEVIANFNTEGKYIPIYFKYVTDDQEQHIYKIDAIKYSREYNHHTSFCCVYTNFGRKYEILLHFYVNECIWCMPFC
jgi:hypothetical protein